VMVGLNVLSVVQEESQVIKSNKLIDDVDFL
jgi:hypothetical protein